MIRLVLLTAFMAVFSFSAHAGQAFSTTPDISISGSATSEVSFGRKSSWLYVRNDCADDLYFDFKTGLNPSYPLRLGQA